MCPNTLYNTVSTTPNTYYSSCVMACTDNTYYSAYGTKTITKAIKSGSAAVGQVLTFTYDGTNLTVTNQDSTTLIVFGITSQPTGGFFPCYT